MPGCRVGADVALLISGSGIIGKQNYQLLLDFTRQLVYGVNVNRKDSQLAVLVFSDDVYVRFYLNDFNNFALSSASDDYIYAQLLALNAISNHYPYERSLFPHKHRSFIHYHRHHHHHHHHHERAPGWSVAVSTSCLHRSLSWASRHAELSPWLSGWRSAFRVQSQV